MTPLLRPASRRTAVLAALAVASLVPSRALAAAPKGCTVLSKWAAMVMVYCPAKTDPSKVGSWLVSIKDSHMRPPGRQVHFHVFTSEKKAPTNAKEFFALADDDYDKFVIARADFNENTGHKEFACKRTPAEKQLGLCNEFIR